MAQERDSERDVLTSLPRTRPVRRSAKRDAIKPRATATPPAASTPKSTPAPKPNTTAKAKPAPRAAAAKPLPVPPSGAGPRTVPPAGYASPSRHDDADHLGPGELIVTAVQAAGELTQIGLTVGRQAVRAALDRLPRP